MEQFKNFVKDYGVYIFGAFIALVFFSAVAFGQPLETPKGWKEDIPYHCRVTQYVDPLVMQEQILNSPRFHREKKEGRVKIIERTDTTLSFSLKLKGKTQFDDTMNWWFSPFKICMQGFVKDAKKA